jgi:hypothetical protein
VRALRGRVHGGGDVAAEAEDRQEGRGGGCAVLDGGGEGRKGFEEVGGDGTASGGAAGQGWG